MLNVGHISGTPNKANIQGKSEIGNLSIAILRTMFNLLFVENHKIVNKHGNTAIVKFARQTQKSSPFTAGHRKRNDDDVTFQKDPAGGGAGTAKTQMLAAS